MRSLPLLVALAALALAAGGGSGGLSVAVTQVFSPNGDGVLERAAVTVTLDAPATVSVEIRRGDGTPVATLAESQPMPAGETALRWDGRAVGGGRVPDGTYAAAVTATAEDGTALGATAPVRVDTAPPSVAWVSAPESVGSGPLRVRLRIGAAGAGSSAGLLVSERSGEPWRSGTVAVEQGVRTASFPLRGRGGGRLAPGAYRVRLEAVDEAGNRRRSAARPLLVEYPVTTHLLRRVDGAGPLVAVTFDDCNDGVAWDSILRTLAARHLQASFFCLGPQVTRHAAQARRTLRAGHTIGDHGSAHRYLPGLSPAGVRAEVEQGTLAWWRLARTAPMPYFRPPYGALSPTALAGIGAAGYRLTVLWDVDPQDWRRPGAAAIAARAVGPARSGSIVLLHVQSQTAAALPAILTGLAQKGLRPVSLETLLARAPR